MTRKGPSSRGRKSPTAPQDVRGRARQRPPSAFPLDDRGLRLWNVRRILASRTSIDERGVPRTEYRVQWDPCWEDAAGLRSYSSTALEEWEQAAEECRQFQYVDGRGNAWTALRDDAPWENDSEESQWEMWTWIVGKMKEQCGQRWFDGMQEDDWVFEPGERRRVGDIAGREGKEAAGSALEVLKETYEEFKRVPDKTCLLYGDVRVRYVGQVDLREDVVVSHKGARLNVGDTVEAIVDHPFGNLHEEAFSENGAGQQHTCWKRLAQKMIQSAPYVLRGRSWILLWVLLLLRGDDVWKMLDKIGIRTRQDWAAYAKEYLLLMYYEEIVDDRAPHDIMETYLTLCQFFRDLEEETLEDPGHIECVGKSRKETDIQNISSSEVLKRRGSHIHGSKPKRIASSTVNWRNDPDRRIVL